MRKTFEERVERIPEVGCWLWTGGMQNMGYGVITNGRGSKKLAHRFSWELHNGPIPEGLHVLHRCDTPLCVNPHHLFTGTAKDNIDDAVAKGRRLPHWAYEARVKKARTHCPHGHEFSVENTYIQSDGGRRCRKCHCIEEQNRKKRK